MAQPLPKEDMVITSQLRSRPVPPLDPKQGQILLEGAIAQIHKASQEFLQAVVDAAKMVGGEDDRCIAGISLKTSGPKQEQDLRTVALSDPRSSFTGTELPLLECPSSLLPEGQEVILLHRPQSSFVHFLPDDRPIEELLMVPFGSGSDRGGVLWLAAYGEHRFHQGQADLLVLLAKQGGLIHKSAREREYLAELVQRTDRSTLLDQLPIGIAKLDQEYRYTYLNDQAIASLHIRPEELLGRSVWEVYPTVAGTFVEDAYRSAMEDRVVNSIELYFEPVETWFDVEAHPAEDGGIVVFFYNADQRKRSESELSSLLESAERQRRYYTTILTTTPDFAYIWGADYTFLYANKALLDLYGLTEEEYVGHSFRDVGYPEWHARMHEQEMDEVIRTGKPLRGKIPFQAKGGSGIYDYIFMPVFGPDGKVEAIAGTTRDVTALERSAETLKEADKRKDEFLAVLAHELRNPLAPLRSGVDLLREDTSPEVLQQAQDIMSRQIAHMVHLVDDLLDLSRVNRGAIELRKAPISLRDVLDLALETVRPLIQDRKHHLHLELGGSSLTVNGDITRLAQVFSNLLNNAAKYTEPGGDITVRVLQQDGTATITISDSGIGIDQQDLAKVFEMFAQVDRKSDRAKGGLGIGLNIVQRLVKMHGGTITAASEGIGKGSDFTITLPLEEQEVSSPQTAPKAKTAIQPLRILIVDDNVDAAFVLSMLLKRLGHEVHATHGGEQAIEVMEGFKPEVVFLDIGMPGMDGYEVCRRMRRLPDTEGCRIVALTGWGQEEDKARTKEAGFDEHLVKPTDKGTILRLLAEFSAQRG